MMQFLKELKIWGIIMKIKFSESKIVVRKYFIVVKPQADIMFLKRCCRVLLVV